MLNSVWVRLPCWLLKGPLKRDFSDIFIITFLGVRSFKNTSAMRIIFFLKMFKTKSRFQKCREVLGNNCFWDNCIWFGYVNPSLLRREYFWPAVNVLPNTPKTAQLPSQWWIYSVKVVSFRHQQCLVPFTMLLVEGSSKTVLFRHVFNHVFRIP